jgi:hypothetical protein
MTTWSTISNAAVAVGAIPSSSTVTALRDNPSAVAESANGAPVVFAGWHPVDKVSVGDGKDGLIYDHAVTGTVSSVVTPDFEDGYEYKIIAIDMSHDDTLSTRRLEMEAFKQTDAIYRLIRQSDDGTSSQKFGFYAEFQMPRINSESHFVSVMTYRDGSYTSGIDLSSAMHDPPAQKILRARISFSSGSIDAGKIWMFRRREYASSP